MNGSEIKRLFQLPAMTLKKNTEGITDGESRILPPGGGSSLNWVFGHILAIRMFAFDHLRIERVWNAEIARPYARGTDPRAGEAGLLPFEKIIEDFVRSQRALESALDQADEAFLATPIEPKPPIMNKTIGEALAFFAFHESYHAGQTGLLRRLVGKAGAIP